MALNIIDIISKKRDKKELNMDEISFFIDSVIDNSIEDYQISALLMAIYINGMTEIEMANLTKKMADSGEKIQFDFHPIVDKHSSGGIGDKVSLIISPMVSSCGLKIAKLSGRALGYSGGTIDKLESIPGFRTDLSSEEFKENVKKIGLAITGQTMNIAPADKKLYALRDVTGTVDSIPLIASSIMSKKLADGSDKIVLDVKCGSGAFMKRLEDAEKLARAMISIGENNGKETIAVISNMDEPLGYSVGNQLEVIEAINFLNGNYDKKLYDLCMELASEMLVLSGFKGSLEEGKRLLKENLDNKKALEKFREMVIYQGGDVTYIDNLDKFKDSKYSFNVLANDSGFVEKINSEDIGRILVLIGGGRIKKEDKIDPQVGIIVNKKIGDRVNKGDILYIIKYNDKKKLDNIKGMLDGIYKISDKYRTSNIILRKLRYER